MTATATTLPTEVERHTGSFLSYGLFAAMLSMAGLPIYIHAPKFYLDEYGVTLGSMGLLLFGLRLFDVVQDPALGWLADRLQTQRRAAVGIAASLMALAMLGIFAVNPPIAPIWWFALTLSVLFTSFSFATIASTRKAYNVRRNWAPMGMSSWRLGEKLAGYWVCVWRLVAPTVLVVFTDAPFTAFAVGFVALVVFSVSAMRLRWVATPTVESFGFLSVVADPLCRRLLLIALVNSTPVAVTSTLFLFFVESRLAAPGWEGPLLLLFFLSAAISTPLWGWAARRWGAKASLIAGMVLSIAAFGFSGMLGPGDVGAFALICGVSGAALGADMTLLPAMFATRLAVVAPKGGAAFGAWSFVSKLTVAIAAVTLLPALQYGGFVPGQSNPASALGLLSFLYSIVPIALKLVALLLLIVTNLDEG